MGLVQADQERLARLEKYVTKVEEAIKDLEASVANGQMESLNEAEISFYLTNLPDIICDAGILYAKIQRGYDYAKFDTKIIASEIRDETVRKKDLLGLSNTKDQEAYIIRQQRFIDAQHSEYEWGFNCKRAQLVYERYNNMFIAVRKLVTLLPTYYEAQNNYIKYNTEA